MTQLYSGQPQGVFLEHFQERHTNAVQMYTDGRDQVSGLAVQSTLISSRTLLDSRRKPCFTMRNSPRWS